MVKCTAASARSRPHRKNSARACFLASLLLHAAVTASLVWLARAVPFISACERLPEPMPLNAPAAVWAEAQPECTGGAPAGSLPETNQPDFACGQPVDWPPLAESSLGAAENLPPSQLDDLPVALAPCGLPTVPVSARNPLLALPTTSSWSLRHAPGAQRHGLSRSGGGGSAVAGGGSVSGGSGLGGAGAGLGAGGNGGLGTQTAPSGSAGGTGGTGRTEAAEPVQVGGGEYPPSARRAHHEGVVSVRVEVLETGRVGRIELAASSGFRDLDQAALKAAAAWRFEPAYEGGTPIKSLATVRCRYVLN